jgi:hypothetical protein
MPGQPGSGKQTFKHYLTENASRTEMENEIAIMDFQQMMVYQIDPQNKTYTKMSLQDMGQMPGMEGQDGKEMQEMMKQMMGSRKVTQTNQTRKVAGYTCKVVNVSFMMTDTEHCVSADVPHYEEIKAMGRKIGDQMSQNPIFKQMGIAEMTEELGGFPVQIITRVMGGTQTTTLKTIKKMDMGDELFKVPADYLETEPY